MNPPSPAPGAPPPAPSGPHKKALLLGIGIVVLIVVALIAFFIGRGTSAPAKGPRAQVPSGQPGTSGSAQSSVLQALPPAPGKPGQMQVPTEPVRPALWVDVYAPGKVREALTGNAWVKEQLQKPLGKGFAGGWAPFLDTRGEELGAGFKGAVFDVVAGQFLAAPFRMVWFSGENRAGTPAIIVPEPGNTTMAAFDSMSQVVRRNELTAATCPGGEGEAPSEGFTLQRWLIAEQALWAARTDDKLVFGRHPAVVLQGLCEGHLDLEAPQGVDVEVGFAPEPLGREAQLLTHVMGMANGIRLQFAVEGNRLVGRGISGPVADEPRLDSAPLSDELLKLIPEETPVLLALQLKLPEQLDKDSLKAFWSGKGAAVPLRTRQVAMVWTPRGDSELPTEVALLWGRPEDAAALGQLFSGPNRMESSTLCGHHVLASTQDVLARLRKACEGQGPNLLNAAAPVVQGLRAPGSVSFGVNTGRLLGTLMADGYWAQVREAGSSKPQPRAAPPEIEAARRDLETLPYMGLRGTVDGNRLVPGGFGS
ncbi:hypothetical protein [Archangium violaceum]|uniref:DUF3352 domain-containing protein n=1 Tax=Archangium violaceum Cb vi76 TaxID=1406225 RepID=A0A084SVS0_9BACT|nr:hypothetical protein [Archangium violaceum]KFA92555.1 hypothetical protein Q664_14785 [Archangium violaceum Cb vi76]